MKEITPKAPNKSTLIKALEQLNRDLSALGPIPNRVENKDCYSSWSETKATLPVPTDFALYDYAVKFFNSITKFQDSATLTSDLFADKKSVVALDSLIKNCGRHESGWVRSKPGEKVTEGNVFLGNVFDIPTLTIKQLKELSKQDKTPKGNWVQWAVQIHQLQKFFKSVANADKIRFLICSILIAEENKKAPFRFATRMSYAFVR